MNQENIEGFLAAVNYKTISSAANSLFITQSSLSHRISMLERELGFELFVHKKGFKNLELTESGENFIPKAISFLDLCNEMHNIQYSAKKETLKIGAMDSINQFLLPSIISEIQNRNTSTNMVYVSYHSEQIYQMLSAQLLDVGFAFYPAHYDIVAEPVFCEPTYMICNSNSIYPPGPIHPNMLDKKDEVLPKWDETSRHWNDEWWDPIIPPRVAIDSSGLMQAFLTDERSWSFCPASIALALTDNPKYSIHPFAVDAPKRICYMLYKIHPNKMIPDKLAYFISEFKEELKKHPWKYPTD